MNYIIGCDAHKRFSQIAVFEEQSKTLQQMRVDHKPGAMCDFLAKYLDPVGLESVGYWYWIMDEIEAAGANV